MRGPVVHGRPSRAGPSGFPTANVAIGEEMLMPADGIYAGPGPAGRRGVCPRDLRRHRPTFYDDRAMTLLEVHVLDFDGDLYGEQVARAVRAIASAADRRFDSVDALAAQLAARLRRGPVDSWSVALIPGERPRPGTVMWRTERRRRAGRRRAASGERAT